MPAAPLRAASGEAGRGCAGARSRRRRRAAASRSEPLTALPLPPYLGLQAAALGRAVAAVHYAAAFLLQGLARAS